MRGEPTQSQPKPRPKLLVERRLANVKRDQYRRTRATVLKRDGHRCRACGQQHGLEAHHVVMRSLGGKDDASNLIALCRDCHRSVHGHVLILRWNGRGNPARTVRFEWVK